MSAIASAAQRLRAVRQASRDFLALWAIESLLDRSRLMGDATADPRPKPRQQQTGAPQDWSFLYRGSLLDD